jgi:hypothetical protein
MIIIPEVNTVYQFSLKVPFNQYNGIYRVHQILTYDQFAALNVNLYDLLYKDVDKTHEEFEVDLVTYRQEPIYMLLPPDLTIQSNLEKIQEKIYYIPKSLLACSPNPNVKAYSDLVLAVRVGPLSNIETLEYIKDVVQENILAATGIDQTVKLASIAIVWMTEVDYQLLDNQRQLDKKHVINYFSETQRLLRENASLKAELLEYKNAILNI